MRFLVASSAGKSQVPEDTHFEEEGVRYRRRSKSAKDLDSQTPPHDLAKQSASLSNIERGQQGKRSPHGSKRSSFEAGIEQAANSPRQSLEKMQRQGSRNDFLPTELIQRSHLFNGQH